MLNTQSILSRLARHLVKRSGSNARVEELGAHLDQQHAAGKPVAPGDVGSLALLALRALPFRTTTQHFARTYAAMVLAGIAAWRLASWSGTIGATENFVEELLALEEFRFGGFPILLAFAVCAVALTLMVVIATRTTIPRAYGLTQLLGLAAGVWAVQGGAIEPTEETLSELFAADVRINEWAIAAWYSAITLPLVASFVILARQSFRRAYAMTLVVGLVAVTIAGTSSSVADFLDELLGTEDFQINMLRAAGVYAVLIIGPVAFFSVITKLAGRAKRSTTLSRT